MKAMLICSTQYDNIIGDTQNLIAGCAATDYIFIPMEESISDAKASDMKNAINTLVAKREGRPTNIWIGTPSVSSKNAWSGYTATMLTSFVQSVYDELKPAAKNMVAGIYMNQESIYADVDYNNVLNGSKGGNKEIRIMKQVGDYAKSGAVHGTKFMWCPYYGVGEDAGTIIKKIGHVADKVQIFDYVFLQPQVMFKPVASVGNLDGVKSSVVRNKVCYRNDVPVIASKVSSTEISYEMEYVAINREKDPDNYELYESRYAQYVEAFGNHKNKPWMFYWQGIYSQAIEKINAW